MSRAVVYIAILALFACAFATAQEASVADAPRFAETEDSAVIAEQQAEFEATLDESQVEDEAEEEDEEEAEDEADEESEEEEEEETEDEASEEDAAEDEEADEEESEEEEEEEEEESDEAEDTEFVLAELQDNAKMTGFMETVAHFKPVPAITADHLVHSLSSESQAAAAQQYSVGYGHGVMAAKAAQNPEEHTEEVEDEEGASFVENTSDAEYIASNGQPYYAQYPAHFSTYNPSGWTPPPPQLPAYLPPPPYITPAPVKGGKDE
jgi:flagellar biosynthesis GTPase FlhF